MDTTTSPPTERPAPAAITPLLRSVVLCDLVDSTALAERIGDVRIAGLMQAHDRLLLRLLLDHQGQLIDKADGVLALFERPVNATAFALAYQRGLRDLGQQLGQPLQARVGIHVGDVMTWTNSPADVLAGAKPVEVEGLAKPVAARLMGLALPGQILMSGMAQNLAQRAQGELGHIAPKLLWRLHGRYRFKGVPAPMLVHEVGELGIAPLRPPVSTEKAWRELPLWRKPPVLALEVVLAVSLAVGGVWSMLKSPPAIAFNERDWVVVADFNNLTGETLYDEALDTALRVGLEQSRYVNVMSDMQVEDALKRMQREGQKIDRQVGAEIALREGAKALVMPTIAHVGGRPKVSAEVIDPASGVTVYTRMADASGSGGVVAALDDVLQEVRADLGEALANIQQSSVPLEEATTSDLEALRAFSLGIRAGYEDRMEDAKALYVQAITRDPAFSMAHLRLASLSYNIGRGEDAERHYARAQSHRDRLSHREALLLDAAQGLLTGPDVSLKGFRLLAQMYPDEFRAYYNFALLARQDARRFDEALSFLTPALDSRNFARSSAYYEQGMIHLNLDKLDDAVKSFEQAASLGLGGRQGSFADAHAARREFEKAEAVLASQPASGVPGWLLEERRGEITFALDQGRWQQAVTAANALAQQVGQGPLLEQRELALLNLSLRSYVPDERFAEDLGAFIDEAISALDGASAFDRRHLVFQVLAAGWMAAIHQDLDRARAAQLATASLREVEVYAANADMATALRAEIELASGRPQAALEMLSARCTGGEIHFVHAVRLRAYLALGDNVAALREADWLSSHRGRAYEDINGRYGWQPVNVIEANLALATGALIARRMGQEEGANQRMARFVEHWPDGTDLPVTVRRISRL